MKREPLKYFVMESGQKFIDLKEHERIVEEKRTTHQMNYKSSTEQLGKTVTQIIHFSGGSKRTFNGILTETIKQGEFTKMMLKDGRMLMVNTANVDCIEVFPEN